MGSEWINFHAKLKYDPFKHAHIYNQWQIHKFNLGGYCMNV